MEAKLISQDLLRPIGSLVFRRTAGLFF